MENALKDFANVTWAGKEKVAMTKVSSIKHQRNICRDQEITDSILFFFLKSVTLLGYKVFIAETQLNRLS